MKKPLRLKPGILIVVLQWLIWMFIPLIFPGPWIRAVGMLGGILGGIAVLLWWAFFSRAPKVERRGAPILWILALFVSFTYTDKSIATGMQGLMFFAYAIPFLSLAFVFWAVISRHFSEGLRRATMIATILIFSGIWTLFRSDGMTGDAGMELAWRWSETYEEKLLLQNREQMMQGHQSPKAELRAEWEGFRGNDRNGVIYGTQIETDWSANPPRELWRRPIGPGCSSFSVQGNFLYTQEQRGDEEVVSCYNLDRGEPVWRYSYEARFWDSHAGAGPRSTPTLHDGRVYSLGATGILTVLDAVNGTLIWSRDAAADTKVETLEWGFAGSPLVLDKAVIVATAGKLAAYDMADGHPLWFGPDGGESYSSPHWFNIDGVEQVLMMSKTSATSFRPEDGEILWEHPWPGAQIVQPAMCENGNLILCQGDAKGIGRFSITQEADGWRIEEIWTSVKLRPNFNDFVIHKGFAYGFEGPSLACLDLEDGTRQWKGGRYGGQILLLADQDLILVLTEKGDLALVEAIPDRLNELASFPAIEGKTWNHPALAGHVLLVRNTQEMAAFELD